MPYWLAILAALLGFVLAVRRTEYRPVAWYCDNGEAGCEVGAICPTPAGIPSAEWHAVGRVDLCHCNCEGCRRACACWLQAQRNVMGPRFRG